MLLLLSTYDLGRQPFGLASPAAWLRAAGVEVVTRDLSRTRLDADEVRRATRIAVYLPMHTATRLALPVVDRARAINPAAAIGAYGLYAPLNAALLREHGVETIIGPEAEEALVRWARGEPVAGTAPTAVPRLTLVPPDRTTLPPLADYAAVRMPDGSRRVTGTTDATRGCKHRCRHCPIVPVYDGQFRVVPVEVVLADVAQQVAAGAEHITFGDPDFFNGPTHARRIVEALHARHPALTYDVTIKVEHLLRHRDLLPTLAATGCLFVTSAVESVDDDVLARLDKGHSRADVIRAAGLCRDAGLTLSPTFVAFTPWTTLDGYRDLLDTVDSLGLIEHVAPVQWGLRLLVTHGSRLLELDDVRRGIGPFDKGTLTYPWSHPDPRVDRLQADVMRLVGVGPSRSRRDSFAAVSALADDALGTPVEPGRDVRPARSTIPYLDEPWYC